MTNRFVKNYDKEKFEAQLKCTLTKIKISLETLLSVHF